MKKISVILPCYNISKYLNRCVNSILNQTIGFDNIELILVDDASTDTTWQIISEIETQYQDNVMAIHFDVNSRQGAARNVGLQYATSDYVAFIDPDDWVEPNYFEEMYAVIAQYKCDYVECGFLRDSSEEMTFFEPEKITASPNNRHMIIDTIDKRKLFLYLKPVKKSCCTKLIKRSFLIDNNISCPEKLLYEDQYWSMLVFLYSKNIYILDKNLYHYYINQNSTVLKKNTDYHTDLLIVHEMLWNEYINRDFLNTYYDELSLEFLFSCYLGFLKILALRYETPSYEHYLYLRKMIIDKIPSFSDNRYIKSMELSDLHIALLNTLYVELNESEFLNLLKSVEASGI